MKNHLKIIAVNLGQRETVQIGQQTVETGIFKYASLDKVKVTKAGLAGDVVVDTRYHGGVDQALYLYSLEDYAWWSTELTRELLPGTFGENLTFSSFGHSPLKIGDRFQINDVVLEVTAPRVPCAKLAARMGDPGFVKRFVQAQRPGVYVRVVKTGTLQTGDTVSLVPTTEAYPTVIELYQLWHSQKRAPDQLRRGINAPLAKRFQETFQFWLDEASNAYA